jgi:glycine/D-amino acid oxidase-like deaminating enzyme
MLRDAAALTGVDAGFRQTGLVFLHPGEDEADVRSAVDRLNALGIVTETLGPDEIAGRYPAFDLEGIGIAAVERDAGYADPHATTDGLLRRAIELGAVVRSGRAVRMIESGAAGVTIATEEGETIACDRALIAAGPWSGPLAAQVGADLSLTVERHVVAAFRWAGAEPVPAHGDLLGGYYFRPEGEDLYLVGALHAAPTADPDRFDAAIREEEVRALAEAVVRRVPHLAASESHGGWASLYDVSPDWQPMIGEIAPGVFLDAGTSGHGFKLAPALGRHVADLVMGSSEVDPALAEFDPFRFERGGALAAGYGQARILG